MLIPAMAAAAVVIFLMGDKEAEELPGVDPLVPSPNAPGKKKRRKKK